MQTFHCSAILFDLDGVLVDSTGLVDQEWRIWARSRELDEEKVVAIVHGVRAIEVIRTVAPHLDPQEELRTLETSVAKDQYGIKAMPGALDLVRRVPEGRWAVVTSGSRELATGRLHLVGIPVPKVMVTADDVINGKPDPEPYLKGAEGLHAKPAECLVIEDAPAGIQAAHAAGMKVIGLASTFHAPQLQSADAVTQTLGSIGIAMDGNGKLRVTIG